MSRFRFLLLLCLLAAPAGAQPLPEVLFVDLGRPGTLAQTLAGPMAGAVVDRVAVGMRLDRLFGTGDGPAARVQLTVDPHRWVARFERIDHDTSGFRSWVGALEGVEYSHVVFTEREGIVSGLINAVSTIYQLRSVSAGSYVLEQLDPAAFRSEGDPIPSFDNPAAVSLPGVLEEDDGSTIDVLMLYTPAARKGVGGTAQIQALASQVISDSNTIFSRSGIVPRLRLVGTTEFALVEEIPMSVDLSALRNSATAQALRDSTHADVVQLLVSSPDPNTCGIGALLSSLSSNFNAYSVADVTCVAQFTPTHEMGHNMGSHHAPEDGASGALFPYWYGFKDPARGFRTVMAYACSGGVSCPRIPNFSNPSRVHNGGPTGTAAQNNAASINNAAPTVAKWRQGGVLAPPAAPTRLRTQVFGSLAVAAWDPSANAASYIVQVGSVSGASDLFNAPLGNTTTISGNVPPGQYFWRVIASNSGGKSAPSSEAHFTVGGCTPPSAPHGFTFSVSGRIVTLNWLAPASGSPVTGYIVEAGSASGLSNLYNGPTGSATPGGVTAVPPGTYFVRLRARNPCGTSGPSNERIITVH